jgi:quinol monooxygenase YgiN
MSHTVVLELTFNPGAGESVIPMIVASLTETRAYQGAELIEPYVDADNPDRLVIWEKWATKADQESYLAWRVETGMNEALAPVLAEPPRFLHLSPAD